MDTFDEIKRAIEGLKYTELVDLATDSGLHVNTLYHIRQGKTWRPSFSTVMRIHETLVKSGHINTGVSD